MHTLIVFAHPEPGSFCGALKDAAYSALTTDEDTVETSDLYAEGFDPAERADHYTNRVDADRFAALAEQRHAGQTQTLASDVCREIERLDRADRVLFVFPIWWHAPPAILKGWMDRVFVNGLLYTSRKRYGTGHFRGKTALCAVTAGAPDASFGPGARGGDMAAILWPAHYSLHYMGFSVLAPFAACGVQGHGYAYRSNDDACRHLEAMKMAWTDCLASMDTRPSLSFPDWQDWDEHGAACRANTD